MIKDFIGVFDNAIKPETCKYFIKHFEKMKSTGFSYKRTDDERSMNMKNDEAINLYDNESLNMQLWGVGGKNPHTNDLMQSFWGKYTEYAEEYSSVKQHGEIDILNIKIQKTLPTQGYHIWHFETSGPRSMNRIMAWMIYLNDVEDGGETEFLYQSMRVKPKQGTLVLWPAHFTHMHRGNPPLSGEKYIMTSWLEFI